MTQSALLEKLNGHEAGLQTHESLFTLYGKVYSTDTHSGNSSVYNGVSGGKRSGVVEGGIASGHASNDDVAGMVVHTGMTLSASAVVGVSGPLGSGTQLGASLSTPNVKANSVRSVEGTIGSMHLSPGTSKIRRGRKKSLGGISINTALASDIEKAGMGSAITAGSNLGEWDVFILFFAGRAKGDSEGTFRGRKGRGSVEERLGILGLLLGMEEVKLNIVPVEQTVAFTGHVWTIHPHVLFEISRHPPRLPHLLGFLEFPALPPFPHPLHRHPIKSIYPPITVPSRPSTRSRLRRIRSLRVLTSLWLASTAAFRRLGKLEEARKAVGEAEGVDALSPDLWCQLGLLSLADKKVDSAIMAFRKALACDPTHVLTKVYLGKTYLEMKEVELAEGLLESVTKGNGWDCAEAW
ncbi:hypothetical protein BC936DRAFT_149302 [Jimgerdemannia flammicorona]|uniref:Uncharacterized protein n=1 Tax=Jimgerdemannia flammicorona TaxID=994334 RepID=A0A433D153_9FUNG|nr:hypothetical protein BC936DRAFT_149302 [Jimgerdemannia flammicorona]